MAGARADRGSDLRPAVLREPECPSRIFRSILPGGIIAVLLWLAASALFALYVANFGSYNKTYGSLGAIIVFLVWLWISNLAILLGAELNAEIARGRSIAAGGPADREPYLRPRGDPEELTRPYVTTPPPDARRWFRRAPDASSLAEGNGATAGGALLPRRWTCAEPGRALPLPGSGTGLPPTRSPPWLRRHTDAAEGENLRCARDAGGRPLPTALQSIARYGVGSAYEPP